MGLQLVASVVEADPPEEAFVDNLHHGLRLIETVDDRFGIREGCIGFGLAIGGGEDEPVQVPAGVASSGITLQYSHHPGAIDRTTGPVRHRDIRYPN